LNRASGDGAPSGLELAQAALRVSASSKVLVLTDAPGPSTVRGIVRVHQVLSSLRA